MKGSFVKTRDLPKVLFCFCGKYFMYSMLRCAGWM